MAAFNGNAEAPMVGDPPIQAIGRQMHLPKMAELIAGELRRQIVRGELSEGEALPSETDLMLQFEVSRPTLREAFRILESEALIVVRRGVHGGARVQLPDPSVAARYAALILEYRGATLDDLYEARIVIEPPCVALLAELRSAQAMDKLRQALADHDAVAEDPLLSMRAHMAFHSLLIELTGNQTLRLLMGVLGHIIDTANRRQGETTEGRAAHERANRKGLAAHHRVLDLIEARDGPAVEQLWRKHLVEAQDYLRGANVQASGLSAKSFGTD
jgi:DNA-binding FadR family transcriptional regulator